MSAGDIFGDERLELSELLSHVLDKGVVLKGEVMLAVADIDLIRLDLGLLLTAVQTALDREVPRTSAPALSERSAPGQSTASGSTMESQVVDALHPPRESSVAPLESVAENLPPRLNTDPDKVENGLAKLVLTLIEVLRKVLEHQAVRRMEGGHLSDAEIEKLGVALLRLNDRMQDMKGIFGLADEDLQIDLGPLGRLR
ncbi:MAG TPA: gas vesicle protein GvpJ [Gemmatimonadaceae bacterium]|nr:gas vesicle protein GvpJ [Gemmatimonadaceae bacterium]